MGESGFWVGVPVGMRVGETKEVCDASGKSPAGADYRGNFQPLPDLMLMMRGFPTLTPRNFITVRNQRGYGAQNNWMWARQELLRYTIGRPKFQVVCTNILKMRSGRKAAANTQTVRNRS